MIEETLFAPAVRIAGRRIAENEPPYMVAELSANHEGSLDRALKTIEAAHAAGADALKLQTYRPDTITLRSDAPEFRISGGIWSGRTLYELYEQAHLPWEWHEPLFACARELGITIFSSPFDHTAVDLLEKLEAPAYKIASFEVVDLPLIRYAASTGKPLIVSTGMATLVEIAEAVAAAREAGCREIVLLHCVSGYPAPARDYNLRTLPDMARRFGVPTGLSDHTLDSVTAIAGIALGAVLVEKHFTLDRSAGGPDSSFSLEPAGFASLCRDCRIAWEARGDVSYERQPSELPNVQFRRSLYFVRALKRGEVVTPDAVRSTRPGNGLAPKFLDAVIGRRVREDVAYATPVRWEVLE